MSQQLIEVKSLERSPLNVRQTDSHAAIDELKASITAHGLMQNLVVVPARGGKYHVIAGGRRLAALQALQAEGVLPEDHAVPCQIAEGDAAEMSLAENTVRVAMHPADEFEAYAALIDKKQTAAQVAVRFGVTEKHVLQRMRLGRVATELLAAFRAEELSLDALMAFALTDDQQRQMSVYKSLQGWQKDNARHIRQCLTENTVTSKDKLAAFVGLDAYKAAGGKAREDLFSEVVYLETPELLHKLAKERLEAEAGKLRAEGWGWVLVGEEGDDFSPYRCGRIKAKPVDVPPEVMAELEKAEAEQAAIAEQIDATEDEDELDALYERDRAIEAVLEDIEERIEALREFDPEEMKGAGCYVTIDHQGDLDIEKGLVKPGDRKASGQPESTFAGTKQPKPEFSQSLLADLKAYRCQAAQVEIAMNPEIAFDLLVFHAASDALIMGHHLRDGLDVHFRKTFPKPSVEGKNLATGRLEAVRDGLPLAWLEVEGEDERFNAFRELSQTEKLAILAYCMALTLKPDLASEGEFPTAYETALALTGGSVEEYWRPTKDNYLSRVTKDHLLAIGKEIFGGDFTARWGKAKKAELAAMLDRGFSRVDDERPEIRARLKAWLPKGMAFRPAQSTERPVDQPKKRGKAA